MKSIKVLTCVAGAILLAGCSTTFRPWSLSEVNEGMDKAEVVKVLGHPDSVEMKDGAEILHYSYHEDPAPAPALTTQNEPGMDMRMKGFEQSLKPLRYEVILVDGKVLSYKEIQD